MRHPVQTNQKNKVISGRGGVRWRVRDTNLLDNEELCDAGIRGDIDVCTHLDDYEH